jgi:TRAP-type C4-dicarboxylate transport system permease small subunit
MAAIPDGVSSLVLFVLMAMTCVDVVGRELFNDPLDGATELTQLMLGIIVFAVLPTVSLREEHVSVDLLDIWFPKRLIGKRQAILNLVMAVIMGVLAWRVWLSAERTADYGDATEYLELPIAPMEFFISIMSGIAAIALAANVVRYARGSGPMSRTGSDQPLPPTAA